MWKCVSAIRSTNPSVVTRAANSAIARSSLSNSHSQTVQPRGVDKAKELSEGSEMSAPAKFVQREERFVPQICIRVHRRTGDHKGACGKGLVEARVCILGCPVQLR